MTSRNQLSYWNRPALFTALTAALMVGACATAQATAGACEQSALTRADGAPTVKVRYHDLNLGTDGGLQQLYVRLNSAAHKVCEVSDIRNLAALAAGRACERAAFEHAVLQVQGAHLAAVSQGDRPRS